MSVAIVSVLWQFGVVGLDRNEEHLAVAETDRFGNLAFAYAEFKRELHVAKQRHIATSKRFMESPQWNEVLLWLCGRWKEEPFGDFYKAM
jgi:hypothetical protein